MTINRETRACLLLGLVLGLGPEPAWANSGIGFLLISLPAMIVALVPAIFIEAPVLCAILKVPAREGLRLSAGANLRSTLIGVGIAFALDFALLALSGSSGMPPGRTTLMISLVPMFFITYWIEKRAIARQLPEDARSKAGSAVAAANVLSYFALYAVIVATPMFKFYDQMNYREELYMAMRVSSGWQKETEDYWEQHKRFPTRADLKLGDPGTHRRVGAVTMEADGRIVVELKFPDEPELDRKRLVLVPDVVNKSVKWRCIAEGLRERYKPHSCREGN